MTDSQPPAEPDDLDQVLSDAERDEMGRRFLKEIMTDTINRAWDAALPPWLRIDRRDESG